MPRIMRRGNIFGSREPVNKVDSSSGSFSSLESEGGVKEVPLRQEKKGNVKHTLDGERPGDPRDVHVPHANVYFCATSVCEFVSLLRVPRESSEARLALHTVTCSSISGPPSWSRYRMRHCFSSNAVSGRSEKEEKEEERKRENERRKKEGERHLVPVIRPYRVRDR